MAFVEKLAKSSALTPQQRAWINGKTTLAVAEQWDTARFSVFIDKVKEIVAAARSAKKTKRPSRRSTPGRPSKTSRSG
jgi:hypothetical protein